MEPTTNRAPARYKGDETAALYGGVRPELAGPPDFTEEQLSLIRNTIAKEATNDELALFLYQARRTGLDPLARQIHLVGRWDNRAKRKVHTIQTSIDGYRLIADRTGRYAGSDDYRFDEGLSEYEHIQTGRGVPTTATVTVYKIVQALRVSFTATVRWEEYFPGDTAGFMWKKMPYLMLGKTAEALALRKAFPAELSGLYTQEEMQQADAPEPAQYAEVVDAPAPSPRRLRAKEAPPEDPQPAPEPEYQAEMNGVQYGAINHLARQVGGEEGEKALAWIEKPRRSAMRAAELQAKLQAILDERTQAAGAAAEGDVPPEFWQDGAPFQA